MEITIEKKVNISDSVIMDMFLIAADVFDDTYFITSYKDSTKLLRDKISDLINDNICLEIWRYSTDEVVSRIDREVIKRTLAFMETEYIKLFNKILNNEADNDVSIIFFYECLEHGSIKEEEYW